MIEEAVRPEEMAEVDEAKREFMKKFGKYAATAPVGMYLLMSPTASKAQASGSTCHTGGVIKIHGFCNVIKFNTKLYYWADGNRQEGNCHIKIREKKDRAFGEVWITTKNGTKYIHIKGKGHISMFYMKANYHGKLEDFKKMKGAKPIKRILHDIGIV